MSEMHPEYEDNPEVENGITYECMTCEAVLFGDRDNTVYVKYSKQPYFDHLELTCPYDGEAGVMWVFDDEDSRALASQFIVDDVKGGFCDDSEIIRLRKEFYDIEDVEEHDITGSQAKKIAFLGHMLNNMTDEELDSEFRLPMPTPVLPRRCL